MNKEVCQGIAHNLVTGKFVSVLPDAALHFLCFLISILFCHFLQKMDRATDGMGDSPSKRFKTVIDIYNKDPAPGKTKV